MRVSRLACVVFWVVLALCCRVTATAAQSGGQGKPPAAEPEPVEAVQEVTAVESPAPPAGAGLFGRMHPALVHFPIAWVPLLLLFEVWALATRREESSRVGLFLLVMACLSFVPAAVSGFLRADAMKADPEILAFMIPHRNLNIAAGVLCLTALALRVAGRRGFGGGIRWTFLLLIAAAAALLMVAGHLGGKMVFGPEYLPF